MPKAHAIRFAIAVDSFTLLAWGVTLIASAETGNRKQETGMAGWSITIIRQAPENYPLKLDRDAVMASWKVGAMGTNWIEELADHGKAQRLKTGGYPNLYTAPAGSVVPLLLGEEPPSGEDMPIRRPREITIRRDELALCPSDEMLTIVVWDQS